MDTVNAELFLAIAALGARYTRESEMAVELLLVARAIVTARVTMVLMKQKSRQRVGVQSREQDTFVPGTRATELLGIMQTSVLLMANSTWHREEPGAVTALSMRSVLHSISVHEEFVQSSEEPEDDWEAWVRFETTKRTRMVIFCLFNIQTIVFDLPPMMLVSDLRLGLPCSEREWRAESEDEWRSIRNMPIAPQQDFQEAFVSLFSDNDAAFASLQPLVPNFSALGGCVIIHGIVQQIWLARNARVPTKYERHSSISADEMSAFERALKRWARYWEKDQEASLDPLSPHGPVTFTSTALLRLAYIRLNMNLGPVRPLGSWNAMLIAQSIHHSPAVERSLRLTRAALHCAHALSIPVKLGINYVAWTQLIHWSNQHAVCYLECAILLAKWLQSITVPNPTPPLTSLEHRVLEFLVHLVAETEIRTTVGDIFQQKAKLCSKVVRLWAKLYQAESVWQMVNLIGQTLNTYADLLDADDC